MSVATQKHTRKMLSQREKHVEMRKFGYGPYGSTLADLLKRLEYLVKKRYYRSSQKKKKGKRRFFTN